MTPGRIETPVSPGTPDFTAHEYSTLLELVVRCIEGRGTDEVNRVLGELQNLVGFEAAIAGQMDKTDSTLAIQRFVNHGYDAQWLETYTRQDYQNIDPVLQYGLQSDASFDWQAAFAQFGERCPIEFVEGASDHGLHGGIACINTRKQGEKQRSFVSFANIEEGRQSLAHYASRMIIPALHQLFINNETLQQEENPLSVKENEVLQWAVQGKSAWEMGTILNISERTVKFHLGNIYRKLNASNRAQAIAEALRRNLV